ncbi:Uma2 family endonuclease [Kitasatospora sp. NPDC048540]|uniref:Uma2 family endonuclease n=1 Tax=unclassified Kitasatospora TaxID=2633591 RepID=UPI00053A699D|nr:Uma2 family endonuclease [Kitasatospora sp. MBT63]
MPAVEHPLSGDDVLRAFLELDTPAGFKAELIEGEIVVSPPPDGDHEDTVARFARAVARQAADELYVSGGKGLRTPRGRFIPDAAVAPVGHFRAQEPWADPAGVLLVLEVTSTNPGKDREAKRLGYASAGIPCYLLIDRDESHATLFTDPADGDYTAHIQVPFGKPLDLPAPFSFALDTAPLR